MRQVETWRSPAAGGRQGGWQAAAICSRAAGCSLGVAVGPDGEHGEDGKAEELQAMRRGREGGRAPGATVRHACRAGLLFRHTPRRMPAPAGYRSSLLHTHHTTPRPGKVQHRSLLRTWMPSPTRVIADPLRMVSGSGVPEDWEVAQMEIPTACTLQAGKISVQGSRRGRQGGGRGRPHACQAGRQAGNCCWDWDELGAKWLAGQFECACMRRRSSPQRKEVAAGKEGGDEFATEHLPAAREVGRV